MSLSLAPAGISPAASLTLARSIPNSTDELKEMSALDLFQTQMAEGNTEAQVDAMKRLPVVAYALGQTSTLQDLIPYLEQLAQQALEDELMLLLAKQMQTLVPNLLTTQTQMLTLLPIIEQLAAVEETVVREQSVVCFAHLCTHLTNAGPLEASTTSALVSMAKRLVGADWFTAKVSAAGMLPPLHQLTKHSEAPYLFKELCLDDTPMVRRAASQHIGAFLASLQDPNSELIAILQQLCQDEQDSVRMLASASLASIGESYGTRPEFCQATFLPILKNASTDMSWRVRHNISKHFSEAAKNLGIQSNRSKFAKDMSIVMACFVSVLSDAEAEVRAAAVAHFAPMVHWGGSKLFQAHLLPILPSLADDVVMEVRSKCALAIMDSSEGGTLEDPLIVNSFGPLLESFLNDEFQEVQLQVLANLHKLAHLLNGMNGVVSAILNMSKAANWRVRQGVATLLPHLAEARGLDFFLTVLLEPAWLVLLLDPVATVRKACVDGMSILTKVAGPEWISEHVLPQHIKIYNHNQTGSYLVRITILQAHSQTALACCKESSTTTNASSALSHEVMTQLLRGITDKVPNVRMVAAQGLGLAISAVKDTDNDAAGTAFVETQVLPVLEEQLSQEEDLDGRAALAEALERAQKK